MNKSNNIFQVLSFNESKVDTNDTKPNNSTPVELCDTPISKTPENPWKNSKNTIIATHSSNRIFNIAEVSENTTEKWTTVKSGTSSSKYAGGFTNTKQIGRPKTNFQGKSFDRRDDGRDNFRPNGRDNFRPNGRDDRRDNFRPNGRDNFRSNGRDNFRSNEKTHSTKSNSSTTSVENKLFSDESKLDVVEIPVQTRKLDIPNDYKQSYASMANKPMSAEVIEANEKKKSDFIEVKKKSFSTIAKSTNTINTGKLPEHYGIRDLNNNNQIHFTNPTFIKKIGGLEKSNDIQSMYRGILTCSIEYFTNPECMMSCKFFRDKISADQEKQEEVFLLVMT